MSIQDLIRIHTSLEIDQERAWLLAECQAIGEEKLQELAKRAQANSAKAYSPYSNFKVGVAMLSISGNIYDGANVERVGYSETDHAEESAITAGVLAGEVQQNGRKFIRAIATSTADPCGRCRQIMVEHADNAVVMRVNEAGEIVAISSLRTLLPYAFTPSDLGK